MRPGPLEGSVRSSVAPASLLLALAIAVLALINLACAPGEEASTPTPRPTRTPTPTPVPTPTPLPASCDFGPGWDRASGEPYVFDFEPSVVSTTTPEMVAVKVKVPANVGQVRMELETGETVTLDAYGGKRFCAILSPDQVLYDYRADDANHNFVGFLDLYSGGTVQARLNGFINVADENISPVEIVSAGNDAQVSPHVVNLLFAGWPSEDVLDRFYDVSRLFYQYAPDIYDFLWIVVLPSTTQDRNWWGITNDVQGIGADPYDRAAAFGSAGHLKGIIRFPIGFLFDGAQVSTTHELGHQFINWLTVPALQGERGHWPISSLARGIMQYRALHFPYELVPLGGGDYRLNEVGEAFVFNDLEMYLLGLASPSEVGEHFVFVNQDQKVCDQCTLEGPTVPLTISDVIAEHGPRVPAYPSAQSTFRVATIVVSTDRLLTAREMAFYDYFTVRGEATEPLRCTEGGHRYTTQPFRLATHGRGTLVTALQP